MKDLNNYISEALVKNHITMYDDFVNLGLPSGKLWAKTNYKAPDNKSAGIFISQDQIEHIKLPKNTLIPSIEDYGELVNNCKINWVEGEDYIEVIGKNGNSIIFPSVGYMDADIGDNEQLFMDGHEQRGNCDVYTSSRRSSSSFYIVSFGIDELYHFKANNILPWCGNDYKLNIRLISR